MKKTLIALAVLTVSSAAFAQSTVTIDGRIDLGMIKATGKSAQLNATNGANQIRFRGTEDLGGGMKANFIVAQRFSPESGLADGTTQRPMMQGESTVGLSGGFGAVKIGRSLTAFQGAVNGTDPYGTLTQGSTAALTAGYATDIDFGTSGSGAGRTDAVTYNSPAMNGVSVGVSYGFKNSASSGASVVGTGNLTSVWASYAAGPLTLGAGQEKNRTGDKVTAFTAIYNFGVAKVGAGMSTVDTVANTSSVNGKNSNFMVAVPMGAITGTLGMSTVKAPITAAKATKTAVGATYMLSKRTNLYSTYGSTKPATGVTTTGYDLGMVHAF
jgi:predicted porin